MAAADRLAVREAREGEEEFRFYMYAYAREVKRENNWAGFGAALGVALVIGAAMLGGVGL